MNIKALFITWLCFATVVAHAARTEWLNTKPLERAHPWVVSPGARLVAGDPRQNEFYILGGGAEREPNASAAPAPTFKRVASRVRVAKKADVAKIELAINETLHKAAASKRVTKTHRLVADKHKVKKTAKSHTPSIAKKKAYTHVKVALHQYQRHKVG